MTNTRHTLVTAVALAVAAVTLLVPATGSAGPSPSTTTGSLVFTSPMDGMSDIYVLQGDGKTVNLTHDLDVRVDVQPHWSPDGSQILFTRYLKNGSASVMRVNADGQKLVNLTPNFNRSVQSIDPNWSPDGSEIVFASNQDGNFDLYTMTAYGKNVAPLTKTRSPLANIEPDWDPNGKEVVFSRQGTVKGSLETSRLYVVDSSRVVTQLTSAKRLQGDRGPVWSPDGKQVAFNSDRELTDDLYVIDLGLSVGPARITWSGKAETDPTWADDGTSLVYVSTATGATEFWALNLKSLAPSAERQLTFDRQYKSHPDWTVGLPTVPQFGTK
jgi:Tol biopolymer transport system component